LPHCVPVGFVQPPAQALVATLALHDALPIYRAASDDHLVRLLRVNGDVEVIGRLVVLLAEQMLGKAADAPRRLAVDAPEPRTPRSEEHTSELQSRENLVCRLLLEKKKHNFML